MGRAALFPLLLSVGTLGCRTRSTTPVAEPAPVAASGVQWVPSHSLPGGFYMGLEGDDTIPGPYVYRIRAPDGAKVAAHAHNQAMHQRVLQGTLLTVIGMPLDRGRVRRVPAGDTITTPANAPHLEWFEGETIIEVHTRGPLTTEWRP